MATSEWLRFFEDAGIPPGPALGYAVAFVDNRIHKNMLLDLTKELMKELGITVVGDVIAILRHAKVVHRQEMCRAASESLQPEAPTERGLGGSVRDRDQRDHRDDRDQRDHRDDRDQDDRDQRVLQDLRALRDPRDRPCGAAERMISNSLRREPPPRSPRGISVTVPNGTAGRGAELPPVPCKRRRVTAEMEGKYVISLPKGTTARTRKILELQAARGLGRTSVFERLGAEAKGAAATAGKPSGVFSRLDPADPDPADPEALPYAGVLKKRRDSPAAAQDGAVSSSVSSSVSGSMSGSVSIPVSGSMSGPVSGPAKAPPKPRLPWGCGRVSSSSAGSVFRRLGRKPD